MEESWQGSAALMAEADTRPLPPPPPPLPAAVIVTVAAAVAATAVRVGEGEDDEVDEETGDNARDCWTAWVWSAEAGRVTVLTDDGHVPSEEAAWVEVEGPTGVDFCAGAWVASADVLPGEAEEADEEEEGELAAVVMDSGEELGTLM